MRLQSISRRVSFGDEQVAEFATEEGISSSRIGNCHYLDRQIWNVHWKCTEKT